MNWTLADVAAHNARVAQGNQGRPSYNLAEVDQQLREKELHGAILDECHRRGWICLHGSMAHRTRRTLGEPDMVILADGGALILVEAKTRAGKLTADQLAMQHWAKKLGHTIHVVRSLDGFRRVCAGGTSDESLPQTPASPIEPAK